MSGATLRLFEGIGIELEYMLVRCDDLSVAPVCDRLLLLEHGCYDDVERGPVAWSNELVLHVVELKTNGPAKSLCGLDQAFAADVRHINGLLAAEGVQLMPTAMHPFFRPDQMRLWPHDHNAVYEAFNRIFDCRGHGWSNLQSTHLNLPFAGDDEFGRLHAAIRLLLPILPALAASSPLVEGKLAGRFDARLRCYRDNARRIPAVSGAVIPEPAYSRAAYEADILAPLYRAIAPHDPRGELQHEWLNARGAIARFDRSAIEIRTLDIQECPLADVALASLIVAVAQAVVQQRFAPTAETMAFGVAPLARLWEECVERAHLAVIDDAAYLRALGVAAPRLRAQELWQHLLAAVSGDPAVSTFLAPLQVVVERGPLASRICDALAGDASAAAQAAVYRQLCACLQSNRLFVP